MWNPVTGCTKISTGCKHCYAERMAKRLHAMGQSRYAQVFSVTLHPELLELPLQWRKPRMILVNSMSDLFHESVPTEFIIKVFDTMRACPRHIFQVLTKRPRRMAELLFDWPPNVWAGVSVEDQATAQERLPWLMKCTSTAIRFVSYEPALGPLCLDSISLCDGTFFGMRLRDESGEYFAFTPATGVTINWIICGCESGPGARPMQLDWARSIRDQCAKYWIPFFLKQISIDKKIIKLPYLDGRIHMEKANPTGER